MKAVLEKACENKDLSREGIVKAFRELDGVDTGGLDRRHARLHAGRAGLEHARCTSARSTARSRAASRPTRSRTTSAEREVVRDAEPRSEAARRADGCGLPVRDRAGRRAPRAKRSRDDVATRSSAIAARLDARNDELACAHGRALRRRDRRLPPRRRGLPAQRGLRASRSTRVETLIETLATGSRARRRAVRARRAGPPPGACTRASRWSRSCARCGCSATRCGRRSARPRRSTNRPSARPHCRYERLADVERTMLDLRGPCDKLGGADSVEQKVEKLDVPACLGEPAHRATPRASRPWRRRTRAIRARCAQQPLRR